MRFAMTPAGRLERRWALHVGGAALLLAATALFASARPSLQHAWVLLVLAPVFEESVFRAGVQEWLSRRGRAPGFAIVATAVLFAAAHVVASGDPRRIAVALPGLVLGIVYARTGRVRDCVVLHAAMNAAWLGAQAIY